MDCELLHLKLPKIAKGENVDPSQYYFRTIPTLEAPKGRYEWVNNSYFYVKESVNPIMY
jgi:hypothetical protein